MLAGVLGAPEEAKLELVFVVGVACPLLAVGMTTLGGGGRGGERRGGVWGRGGEGRGGEGRGGEGRGGGNRGVEQQQVGAIGKLLVLKPQP